MRQHISQVRAKQVWQLNCPISISVCNWAAHQDLCAQYKLAHNLWENSACVLTLFINVPTNRGAYFKAVEQGKALENKFAASVMCLAPTYLPACPPICHCRLPLSVPATFPQQLRADTLYLSIVHNHNLNVYEMNGVSKQ